MVVVDDVGGSEVEVLLVVKLAWVLGEPLVVGLLEKLSYPFWIQLFHFSSNASG